ncbi:MAG TPA: ABC transporter substrate-binding protein [Candidatus Binatia bacterium]
MKLRWASDAPTWPGKAEITIARAKGYLKEAGIEQADIRAIPGEMSAVEALLGGEVDVISGMARKALIAHSGGAPIRLIAMPNNSLSAGLAVNPDLGDPADLKGKTVAVGVFGALVDRMARLSVERLGVNPSEVHFIEGGTGSLRIAMVQRKEIAGAILMHTNLFAARRAGLMIYDTFSDRYPAYAYHALSVLQDTLAKRRELVVALLIAYLRARSLLKDSRLAPEVADLFTPQQPGGGREAWLDEQRGLLESFTPDLRFDDAALSNAVQWEQEAGTLPPGYDYHDAMDEGPLLEALARRRK